MYNTFPWLDISEQEKKAIELTAQEILKVRAKYSTSSLAALYDDNIMPSNLRTAHQKKLSSSYGSLWYDKNRRREENLVNRK